MGNSKSSYLNISKRVKLKNATELEIIDYFDEIPKTNALPISQLIAVAIEKRYYDLLIKILSYYTRPEAQLDTKIIITPKCKKILMADPNMLSIFMTYCNNFAANFTPEQLAMYEFMKFRASKSNTHRNILTEIRASSASTSNDRLENSNS
jgi:hypothetical protein